MKHSERVEDYLEHIAEAIERVCSYVQPLPDVEAFQQQPQVQDAVVRNIEFIGEAVNHINRMAPELIVRIPRFRGRTRATCTASSFTPTSTRNCKSSGAPVQEDLPKLKQQIDQLLSAQQPGHSFAERFGTSPTSHEPETVPDHDDEP